MHQDDDTLPVREHLGFIALECHIAAFAQRLRAFAALGATADVECPACGGAVVPLMTIQRCAGCGAPWHLAVARPAPVLLLGPPAMPA
jgi:hypothetical protein